MTRHASLIFALTSLLMLTARSMADRPGVKPSYVNADLRVRLDPPVDFPLAVRTTGFSDHLGGTLCEFMPGPSRIALVGITGVILHHATDQSIDDYALARENELSSLKDVSDFAIVEKKPLDRRTGEWLQREYRVVKFGTTFRYFAVYVADGKDRYALILYGNAREDEKMLSDTAASLIASFSVGAAPEVGGSSGPTVAARPATGPATRLFATTSAADDAKRLFAVARRTPLREFPTVKPFRPPSTTGPATHPTTPGSNCVIICCKTDGGYIVYMMNADGSDLKEVGRFKADRFMDQPPVFSANTRRAAVASIVNGKGNILVSDLDGKESRVAVPGLFPCLSPDGSRLAYLSDNGPWELYTCGLDHGPGRPVSRPGGAARPNGDCHDFAWSPDGGTLYFASDFAAPAGSVTLTLYALDVAANALRKLCDVPERRTFKNVRPSPDGKTLLMTCGFMNTNEIYSLSSQGGQVVKILDGCYLPLKCWSDDGKRIIAASSPSTLISCKPDGTDRQTIVNGQFNFLYWNARSPQAIVLGPTPAGRQGVILCGADGKNPNWLSKIRDEVICATWCEESAPTTQPTPAVSIAGRWCFEPVLRASYEAFLLQQDGNKITGKTSWDGQITGTFDGHTLIFEITYSAKSIYPRPISKRTGTLHYQSDIVGSDVPTRLLGPYVDFKPDGTRKNSDPDDYLTWVRMKPTDERYNSKSLQ